MFGSPVWNDVFLNYWIHSVRTWLPYINWIIWL